MPMHSSTTLPRESRPSRPSAIRVDDNDDDNDDDDDNLDSHLMLGRTGSAALRAALFSLSTSHSRISFMENRRFLLRLVAP